MGWSINEFINFFSQLYHQRHNEIIRKIITEICFKFYDTYNCNNERVLALDVRNKRVKFTREFGLKREILKVSKVRYT